MRQFLWGSLYGGLFVGGFLLPDDGIGWTFTFSLWMGIAAYMALLHPAHCKIEEHQP